MQQKTSFIVIAIAAVLLFVVLGVVRIGSNGGSSSPRKEIPKENQDDLKDDTGSITTIIEGFKADDATYIGGVNDSGNNSTIVTSLDRNVKFIYPLSNGRQLLYIGKTDDSDLGETLEIKNIKPKAGAVDGEKFAIYTSKDGYRIDRLTISENNKWVAWYEVKPESAMSGYTHLSDYFRSYKANLEDVMNSKSTVITPTSLLSEKAEPNGQINLPVVISNSGEVYFDAMVPSTYALYYGFKNEKMESLLPVDTYNSKPYLFEEKYFLYTAFEPSNSKLPADGDKDSTRQSIVNTNIAKVYDVSSKTITVVAPGNEGEHYKHPVYVSGSLAGDLTIAAEVYTLDVVNGRTALVPSTIQTITRKSDGSFEKKVVFEMGTESRFRILSVGKLKNGHMALFVGEENAFRGNLGTGVNVGPSGYKNKLTTIRVIDLEAKETVSTISPSPYTDFEFISLLPKLAEEKIGIERDKKLATDIEKHVKQLQLQTFEPVEPKRERKNPRSECETEWEKKGYPNYEACEACPVYIYSPVKQKVNVKPKTAIDSKSAVPALTNGNWEFTADSQGILTFENGAKARKIDFLFPRGRIGMPNSGWTISANNFTDGIEQYALMIGLNKQESKDVVDYVLPQVLGSSYIVLSTLPEEQREALLDFSITPNPTSYSSVVFYVKKYGVQPEVSLVNPTSRSIKRDGLTVVSWGVVFDN